MEERILIKSGEFFLKGNNRFLFENQLLKNIENKISKFGVFLVKNYSSVITVNSYEDNLDIIVPILSKIFGISYFSKAFYIKKDINKIKNASIEIFSKYLKNINSFKIETKRSDKTFFLNSFEVNCEIGSVISKSFNIKVDVNEPDLILNIEIRNDGVYLYTKKEKGMGGLPVGVSGSCSLLLSGGIDSAVAFFLMAKRGINITCIHFETPPYTSEMLIFKIQKLINKLLGYINNTKLYLINFTKIQESIKKNCSAEFFTIISRRIMNAIAQKISILEKCSAIVTGESLGQVASQTLPAILCTNESINLPIFRPLISFDKSEIISLAKKIGTFEISIEPYVDCCSIFSPKHPKTKPIVKFVKLEEKRIENLDCLIQDCLSNCKIFDY